jgi:SAM-dependent methyltransferase
MKYFKNTELARIYNVSEKSVRNWIEATEGGKLDLQLYEHNGRRYIANTSKNTLLLEPLVEKGKKYRNSRGYKTVTPTQEFYGLYSPKQILDIIANIDKHREVPYQYNYFDGGATHWDKYTQRLLAEGIPSTIVSTVHQIETNKTHLDEWLEDFDQINVIDVGAGNALPVKGLLDHLISLGKLKRYIIVDISPDMLDIAKRNVKKWFDGQVQCEDYVRDMSYDRFDDLLVSETFETSKIANVVTLFGGTIYNLREPDRALKTICDSMGKNDLLLSDEKLDSEKSRRYFDFSANSDEKTSSPGFRGKGMLDLLGIPENTYKVEQFFDEQKMMRLARIRLDVALSIEFKLEGGKRTLDLNKGDTLLLWRAWHLNILQTIEMYDRNGFDDVFLSSSKDSDYVLMAHRLKSISNI